MIALLVTAIGNNQAICIRPEGISSESFLWRLVNLAKFLRLFLSHNTNEALPK